MFPMNDTMCCLLFNFKIVFSLRDLLILTISYFTGYVLSFMCFLNRRAILDLV